MDFPVVRRRIERAQQHINAIRDEVRAYSDNRPYSPVVENEADLHDRVERGFQVETDRYERMYQILAGVVQPPPQAISILCGDVLHSLRAALDNLAWELVLRHSSHAPVNRANQGTGDRLTSFPIRDNNPNYGADGLPSPPLLWPLTNARVETVLDGLQPYTRGVPGEHPLAVIRDLNNTDKHQAIPLITSIVQRGRCLAIFPNGQIIGFDADSIHVATPSGPYMEQALEPNAFLGYFLLSQARSALRDRPGKVQVDAYIEVGVSLDQPGTHDAPAPLVDAQLQDLVDFVRDDVLPPLEALI